MFNPWFIAAGVMLLVGLFDEVNARTEKPKGIPGPAGPAGKDGKDGAPGPAGKDGKPGKPAKKPTQEAGGDG